MLGCPLKCSEWLSVNRVVIFYYFYLNPFISPLHLFPLCIFLTWCNYSDHELLIDTSAVFLPVYYMLLGLYMNSPEGYPGKPCWVTRGGLALIPRVYKTAAGFAASITHRSQRTGDTNPRPANSATQKLIMNLSLKTFSFVLLLFAAVSCAPVEHSLQDACADVRTSSYKLNQIAQSASAEVSLFWIQSCCLFYQNMSRKIKNIFGILFKTLIILFYVNIKLVHGCFNFKCWLGIFAQFHLLGIIINVNKLHQF